MSENNCKRILIQIVFQIHLHRVPYALPRMDPEDIQGPDRTYLDWDLDCLEWDELPDDMPRVNAYFKIADLVEI